MQAILVMFRSDGERRSFSVTRDMTVIGRREDCDLRIPLHDVSRKHARLVRDGDALRLEDLGSSNGTFLNGQRVQEAILSAGDSVQIGPVVFVLQVDGMPADDELRPITADLTEQTTAPPIAGVSPLLPPVMPTPPAEGDIGIMANEFETLEPLAMDELDDAHLDAAGIDASGIDAPGIDAHEAPSISAPRKDARGAKHEKSKAAAVHAPSEESDELEWVDVPPMEMEAGHAAPGEVDMDLGLALLEDETPTVHAPPPPMPAARMAPPPPLSKAPGAVPPPPPIPAVMAPPPPPVMSAPPLPPLVPLPPLPVPADDELLPLEELPSDLDDELIMDEPPAVDAEMELADLTDFAELSDHSEVATPPPVGPVALKSPPLPAHDHAPQPPSLMAKHSDSEALPIGDELSELEPLPLGDELSELEPLPLGDEHSALEPLPVGDELSELEPLPLEDEHSELKPLPLGNEHSALEPLPVGDELSELEPLPLSETEADLEPLPLLEEHSDLGPLPMSAADDAELEMLSDLDHSALEPMSASDPGPELLSALDDHSVLEPLPLSNHESGDDFELEPLSEVSDHAEFEPAHPAGSHSGPPPFSTLAHPPKGADHSEPEPLHLSNADSEPDILPMLGEEESDLGELPLLLDDGDLDVISDEGHHLGKEPVNLDVGVNAPHQPHA